MARRRAERDGRDQAERYRQAAEDAPGNSTRASDLSTGMSAYIRRPLLREASEPLTSETARES